MKSKEKASVEATLKNILYFVEDKKDQEQMIEILNKYNDKLPDGAFKDKIQNFLLKSKKDYYEKVDFLVNDILNGSKKSDKDIKNIISEMLNEIKNTLEKAERTFWDKLCDLFKWS